MPRPPAKPPNWLRDRLRLNALDELYSWNERVSAAVSVVIIAVMLTCVAQVAVLVGQRLAPGWNGSYLMVVSFFVALEAVLSTRLANNQFGVFARNRLVYRVTELVFILLVLKLILYLQNGFGQLLADLPRWRQNLLTFFEGEYAFASLLAVMIWVLGWLLASTVLKMEGDVELLERETLMESSRVLARRALAQEIFAIGAGLLVMTAFLRVDLSLFGLGSPAAQRILFSVLLYFVLGLILFSQGHFAVLRAIWSMERIEIGQNLAARWVVYSVAMLVGIGVLVGFLPTRYTVGLLSALAYLLQTLTAFIFGLEALVVAVLYAFFQWLINLLWGKEAPLSLPPPEPTPTPTPSVVSAAAPIPWLEVFKSLLFWAVFLGILGYSLYYYLKQRKDILAFLRRLPLWRWLARAWQSVQGSVRGLNQMVAKAVQDGLRRLRSTRREGEPWGYLGLRRLSPRDRVRFLYLALVRRGGESGLPRHPAETPYEYENDLNVTLPQVDDDVSEMTEAFIEARYSRHEIAADKAQAIRRRWEQIRKALRERRKR